MAPAASRARALPWRLASESHAVPRMHVRGARREYPNNWIRTASFAGHARRMSAQVHASIVPSHNACMYGVVVDLVTRRLAAGNEPKCGREEEAGAWKKTCMSWLARLDPRLLGALAGWLALKWRDFNRQCAEATQRRSVEEELFVFLLCYVAAAAAPETG